MVVRRSFHPMDSSILKACGSVMTDLTVTMDEKQLVGRCLYEAANGEYFADWEFESLIGADRATVRKAASDWLTDQSISAIERDVTLSVLNNILGYPHSREKEFERAVGVQLSFVQSLYSKLSR